MPENVQINLNVTDNGTTARANAEAAKLRGNLEGAQRAASSTKAFAASAAARPASSAMNQASDDSNMSRGVGGVTGAAGRDFAAQAQGLGGLVHVYATFAANLFAVTAAFSALSKAADVTNMVKGLDQLGATSGQALGSMAKHLTVLTDGAISLKDAMTATAQATAGGLSGDQLSRLTVVAKNASQALGRDMPDALSRLTRGIVKIEPELLDELGIMTKVIPAQQAYARELGKSVTALTDFEKRQAFANAAITEGEKKFGSIQIDANPYSKLLASMTNLALAGAELANKVLGPVAKILAESPTALGIVMAGIATMLLSKAIPALSQWREGLVKSAEAAAQTAKKLHDAHESFQISKSINLGQSITAPMERAALDSLANVQTALTNALPKTSKIVKKAFSEGFTITDQDISNYKSQATRMSNIQTAMENARSSMGDTDKVKSDALDKEILSHKKRTEEMHRAVSEAQTELALRKQINIELDKVHNTVAKDPSYLSMEAALKRKADSAAQTSARANILSQVGANTQSMGMGEAWSKLKQDIDSSEVALTKTNKVFTLIKGGATIASSAIMTLASSLGNVFMVIGIATAVFSIIEGIFGKNTKQVEALNSSLETLNSSMEGATRNAEYLAAQDGLKSMTPEAIQSRATAFNELSSSIISTSKALSEADNKASGFDKFIDGIKSLWSGDLKSKASDGISKAITSGLDNATNQAAKDRAKTAINELISPKDLSASSIEKALNKFSGEEYKDKLSSISEIMKTMSQDINNSASSLTAFSETMKNTEKTMSTLISSFTPSDNMSKFGIAEMDQALALGKAMQSPIEGISALATLVGDFNKLKLLPPEAAQKLQSYSKDILEVSQQLGGINSQLILSNKRISDLKENAVSETTTYQEKGRINDSLADEFKLQAALENAQKDLTNRASVLLEKNAGVVKDSYIAGSNHLSTALKNAAASAALEINKVFASQLVGSAQTDEMLKIQLQEIGVQEAQIKSQQALILSQEKLRITMEQSALKAERDLSTTTPERKTQLNKSIAGNEGALSVLSSGASSKQLRGIVSSYAGMKEMTAESLQLVGALQPVSNALSGIDAQLASLGGKKLSAKATAEFKLIQDAAAAEMVILNTKERQAVQQEKLNDQLFKSTESYSQALADQRLAILATEEEIAQSKEKSQYKALDSKYALIEAQGSVSKANREKSYQEEKSKLDEAASKREFDSATKLLDFQNEASLKKIATTTLINAKEMDKLKLSQTIRTNELSAESTRLDAYNSVYTLNQEMYSNTKKAEELEKAHMQYVISMQEIKNAKELEYSNIILERDMSIKRAALQFSQDKDINSFSAATTSAMDNASSRTNTADTNASNKTAEAESLLGLNIKNAEVAAQIRDITREQNELLAAQASLVESLTAVFGDFGTALGGVVQGFASMAKSQDSLTKGRDADLSAAEASFQQDLDSGKLIDKQNKIQEKYQKESVKNELTGYASMAKAMKGFFNEKSAGYALFDGIEKAMHAWKLASLAIELAASIAAVIEAGSLAAYVDQQNAIGKAPSVLMRFAADYPYVGLAIGAAVVAAILGSMGGGGSVSMPAIPETATAEYQQKNQGTGTVLGDSEAKSESIANGIDILSEHSFEMLDYTQNMLSALERIYGGISNLATSLTKLGGITGVGPSAFGTVESKSVDAGVLGWGAESSSTEIINTGIYIKGTVDAITNLNGVMEQFETTAHSWTESNWFSSDSGVDISTQTKALTGEAVTQIGMIFGSMTDSIKEGIGLLGMAATGPELEAIMTTVGNIPVNLTASLQGLSGDDITDALNGVFSAAFDNMVDAIMPYAKDFQQLGEGIGETFIRLASNARSADLALKSVNMSFPTVEEYTKTHMPTKNDLAAVGTAQKTRDDLAAKLKASQEVDKANTPDIVSFNAVGDSDAGYGLYEKVVTPGIVRASQDTILAGKALIKADEDLAAAHLAAGDTTMDMSHKLTIAREYLIEGAGGIDAFVEASQFFGDTFLTETERLKPTTAALKTAFKDMSAANTATGHLAGLGAQLKNLNYDVPRTREEFTAIVQSLDLTTTAGADLYNTLMSVAPAFDAVTSAMEDIANTVANIASRGEDMKRSFTMDTLDNAGKYKFLQNEDTTTRATMLAKDDKGEYVQTFTQSAVTANKLLDTINQAWGLMNEDQKKANLGAYTQKVDEVMTFMKARGIEEMAGMTPDGINTVEAINKSADLIATAIGKLDPNYDKTKDTTLAKATEGVTQSSIDTIISQTFAAFSAIDLTDTSMYSDPLSLVADKLPEASKTEASAAISSVDSIATEMGINIAESISAAIATNPQISAILTNPTDAGVTAAGMTTAQLPTAMSGVLSSLNSSSSATVASIDQMVSMFNNLETTLANAPESPEIEAFKQDLENNKQALMDQKSSIEAQQAAASAAVAELAAGTGSLSSVASALSGLIASLAAVAKEPAQVSVAVSVSAPAGSEVGTSVI